MEGVDGLVGVGYEKHFRVNHGANEFARGHSTSTALSHSGAAPSTGWQGSTASRSTPSTSTPRNVNTDSAAVTKTSTRSFSNCYDHTRSDLCLLPKTLPQKLSSA